MDGTLHSTISSCNLFLYNFKVASGLIWYVGLRGTFTLPRETFGSERISSLGTPIANQDLLGGTPKVASTLGPGHARDRGVR